MASSPVDNPMAGVSYALLYTGIISSLVSVAAIVNPEKHMRSFLPDSLPEDKKSLDQLILFHFTGMGASPLQFASLMIAAAFACPCLPAVYMFVIGFLLRCGFGLYFAYGPPAELMGLRPNMVFIMIGVIVCLIVGLVAGAVMGTSSPEYTAFTEYMEANAMAKFTETPFLSWTIVGVNGFFVLANLPAIFAPSMAMESYLAPGALASDKYFLGKFTEYMKLNALFWVLTSFFQLALAVMALDFTILGPIYCFWNLFYNGLFVYNLAHSEYYGFNKLPMLFFLTLVTTANGAIIMGLADAYL